MQLTRDQLKEMGDTEVYSFQMSFAKTGKIYSNRSPYKDVASRCASYFWCHTYKTMEECVEAWNKQIEETNGTARREIERIEKIISTNNKKIITN